MEKINPIKNFNSKEMLNIEDSIFNSKLFLHVNYKNDDLNNSISHDSGDSTELEDLDNTTFLTKELIEELNSSNLDISLKDENIPDNNISLIYSINNGYPFTPLKPQNNDIYEDYLFNNEYKSGRYNKYNINKNSFKNKHEYKRIKIIKDKKRDWVCQICFNLNYSFRTECNRCKLPKERCIQNTDYIY